MPSSKPRARGGGSKPGERRGGRQKGTPNKATIEKIEALKRAAEVAPTQQERQLAAASLAGRKLAREVLDEFMTVFAGMAARYQPVPERQGPDGEVIEGRVGDPALFHRYATLACQVAKDLAPYQSPTYRAIMVAPPPTPQTDSKPERFTLTIIDNRMGRVAITDATRALTNGKANVPTLAAVADSIDDEDDDPDP